MPIFLDRRDPKGLAAADIAEVHRKDLEIQEQYGVRFLTYWFDEKRGHVGYATSSAPLWPSARAEFDLELEENLSGDLLL